MTLQESRAGCGCLGLLCWSELGNEMQNHDDGNPRTGAAVMEVIGTILLDSIREEEMESKRGRNTKSASCPDLSESLALLRPSNKVAHTPCGQTQYKL